jgi:hypothetical protein
MHGVWFVRVFSSLVLLRQLLDDLAWTGARL